MVYIKAWDVPCSKKVQVKATFQGVGEHLGTIICWVKGSGVHFGVLPTGSKTGQRTLG